MLVCRQFYSRSRRIVPSAISFSNSIQVVQTKSPVHRCWKGPKHVYIRGSKNGEQGPVPHLGPFAAMKARKWTRITELGIRFADWRPGTMHPDTFLYLSTLSSVTRLSLGHVKFPTIGTFGRLITALLHLERLKCYDVQIIADRPFDAIAFKHVIGSQSKLSRLDFDNLSEVGIIKFLIATGIIANIRELSLTCDGPCQEAHNICHLLSKTKLLLRTLNISMVSRPVSCPEIDNPANDGDANHSPLWTLESLRLDPRLDDTCCDPRWLTRSLSQFKWDTIGEVSIILNHQQIYTRRYLSQVEQCFLSWSAFEKLKKVIFELEVLPSSSIATEAADAEWYRKIVHRFPRLHKRGILHTKVLVLPG